MTPETLAAVQAARGANRAVVLVTDLASGADRVIDPAAPGDDPLGAAAVAAAKADRSGIVEAPDGARVFLNVFNPPLKLVVVGAVHIAKALARMADLAGYTPTIIDPRGAFAAPERWPGVAVSDEWPDEAMARMSLDARTAIVTLTHDPKIDDPAIEAALASPAFYIGCLGSKKTHAARLDRLAAKGFDAGTVARIHGPVGLAIGARSPAEIAVAILAQMTNVLRGGRVG